MARRLAYLLMLACCTAGSTACARGIAVSRAAPPSAPTAPLFPRDTVGTVAAGIPIPKGTGGPSATTTASCDNCEASSLTPVEVAMLERRIADLRERGEPCATYATIMERSVHSGQITMRPYMWRVGSQLASGEARPDGAMIFAREIDPLNLGRRSFDEVVWTIEHEAAHIAFNLDSPLDRAPGDRADAYVKSCRS